MLAQRHRPALPDQLLDRLVWVLALVLLIGVPAFAIFYWVDRHPDPGPSMVERTVVAAEEAVRQAPSDLAARNRLAAAYVSAGRYDDGITQFGEALVLSPDNRAALLGRGIAYRLSDRLDLALADFERLVTVSAGGEMAGMDPQLQQAYYEIGLIDLKQGRPAEAVTALESALRIDSTDADSLYEYGSALIETGEASRGIEALQRAVAFVPSGWCEPYYRMVDGYTALADAPGAAYANGMVAFCEGRLDTAKQQLAPLTSGAYRIDAWLGLALTSAASGDSPQAIAYYQMVLAEEPENTSALIGLGQLGGGDAHATPVPSSASVSQ
jgi:tetratricopeptide (TPR) repeat protein